MCVCVWEREREREREREVIFSIAMSTGLEVKTMNLKLENLPQNIDAIQMLASSIITSSSTQFFTLLRNLTNLVIC